MVQWLKLCLAVVVVMGSSEDQFFRRIRFRPPTTANNQFLSYSSDVQSANITRCHLHQIHRVHDVSWCSPLQLYVTIHRSADEGIVGITLHKRIQGRIHGREIPSPKCFLITLLEKSYFIIFESFELYF